MTSYRWICFASVLLVGGSACSRNEPVPEPGQGGGAVGEGGSGGNVADGGQAGTNGGSSATILVPRTGVEYHPPDGFEDCTHVEVEEDCRKGWCRLPPSCFVIGAPDDEWMKGRYTDVQVAITFTRAIEVQRYEMTRSEWSALAGTLPEQPDNHCLEDDCPINNVTWWEAVHAANLLSERRGLEPCYDPVSCTGDLGQGLSCAGVADPEASIYGCEGYRLPTRSEAEYAARAGTVSTWYSGGITVYNNLGCNPDENLSQIAWYCDNSNGAPHIRGTRRGNGFGLFDMIGNVAEWSSDEDRYVQAIGGIDPAGSVGEGVDRQHFGGSYDYAAAGSCRTASIVAAKWDVRGPQVGFRLYRTLFEDSVRSGPIIEE